MDETKLIGIRRKMLREKDVKMRQRKPRQQSTDDSSGKTQQEQTAPLEMGIKEMPVFDPDMEFRGLALTIPTWMNAIARTRAKTDIDLVSEPTRAQAVLDTTLRLAIATWEGENNSLSGSILMGIARIVVAYGDSLKEDVFKDHVGRVSVKAIIRAAKERRPGALGYSEAMIIEYNKKSKFRLSLKTLYGGKQTSDEDEFGEE